MTNKSISNARNLSDIIVAMTQTETADRYKKVIKPQERTEKRKKENSYLVNEIANSLMTARL